MPFGTPLIGANETLRAWKETVPGTTPATPKSHVLPIISHGLGVTRDKATSRILRGDPNPTKVARGFWKMGGQFVMPIGNKTFGLLMQFFLPAYSKSGVGPYVHTNKVSSTVVQPSVGFEQWRTDSADGDVEMGNMINSVEISIRPAAEEASVTYGIIGMGKHEFENTAYKGSPTAPTTYWDEEWMSAADAKILIDTAQVYYILDSTLRITRDIEMIQLVDGTKYASYIIPKRYTVTGNLNCLIDDSYTARILATGEAEHKLEYLFPAPVTTAHQVRILMNEIAAEITAAPALNDTGRREINLEFNAYLENDADATSVETIITNAVVDYAAII